MAITTKSEQTIKQSKKSYPYLGISINDEGKIVLFTSKCTGVVVQEANRLSQHSLGYTSNGWDESCFNYFIGSLTLTQNY